MDTDQLVRDGIEYLKANIFGEMPWYMRQFYAGGIGGTVITRFSVALNYETKDVRYLERLEFWTPKNYIGPECERIIDVYQVFPKRVFIHTEYERL